MTGALPAGMLADILPVHKPIEESPVPEEIVRQYLFDRPGFYLIRVLGAMEQRWLSNLAELNISVCSWGSYSVVTQISGWLSDQTALGGLLDLLNNLGMVILTVNRLKDDEQNDHPRGQLPGHSPQ